MPRFARSELKPYLAEFVGTALIVLIGDGVIAQCLLSDYQFGSWLSINLSWAVAIALSGYLSDPSPTVNPAVSIAMALIRPSQGAWKQLPGKIAAQVLGGFVGAALVYANYVSAIDAWDPERTIPGGSISSPTGQNSAGIFATYPTVHYAEGNNWGPALNEGLGAAFLMFALLTISDPLNKERFVAPQFSVFATVLGIGAALGWQTGYVSGYQSRSETFTHANRLSIPLEILAQDFCLQFSMAMKFSACTVTTFSCLSWLPLLAACWALRCTTRCFMTVRAHPSLMQSTSWTAAR